MPLPMHQQKESLPLSGIKNIVAVAAGKGGVGKSSVTVNLGLALKKMGYSVGIMDLDIYGPSVRKMLPENTPPKQRGEFIVPAMCEGIRMISMAYFRKNGEASVVRAPIANGLVNQFIKNVDWGDLDYLLIDFPPGTGDIQLTISQQANLTGAVMVTTPQEVAVMDVRKAMNMFEQVKIPIIGIIENMSYYIYPKTEELIYIFGKGGGEKLANETRVAFLGNIPIDPQLCQAGDEGKSLFSDNENKDSSSVIAFQHITKKMIEQLKILKEKDNISNNFDMQWKDMSNANKNA